MTPKQLDYIVPKALWYKHRDHYRTFLSNNAGVKKGRRMEIWQLKTWVPRALKYAHAQTKHVWLFGHGHTLGHWLMTECTLSVLRRQMVRTSGMSIAFQGDPALFSHHEGIVFVLFLTFCLGLKLERR